MIDFIRLARPRQWTKNLLVLAGLIFSGLFFYADAAIIAVCLFVAFCFASSSGYAFNDVRDAKEDSMHPTKRDRPVASGRIAPHIGILFGVVLLVLAIALACLVDFVLPKIDDASYHQSGAFRLHGIAGMPVALLSIAAYLANQFFYSFFARGAAILDVFVIALGFLIRAVAGAVVLGVTISQWLLLCTLFLALFLGFAKRRNELSVAIESRESLGGYTQSLLDNLIAISASAAVIAYSLYAIQSSTAQKHPLLALTIPFPVFGIFRYLQITFRENDSGNPDLVFLRDPWIWGTVLVWGVVSLIAMSHGVRR